MVIIVISVAVQGPGVDASLKGDPSERWTFVRSGFFEAIGVISFAFVVGPSLPCSSDRWETNVTKTVPSQLL